VRSERQEITHRGRRRATLASGWWRRFGILCLQLCLFWAATAMAARAQSEQKPDNVTFTTLVNFDLPHNGFTGGPPGPVVQGSDGNLYGVTTTGGATVNNPLCAPTGCGTVFKITPTGALTTLYSFCSQPNCADGGYPPSGLVLGADGNFYGITGFGGTGAGCYAVGVCGTAFKITPSGTLTTLHNWCSQPNCADGFYGFFPDANTLVQATDGNFYGTTDFGGANGFFAGTFFKLTPSGSLTTLYSFCSQPNCTDGALPVGLTQASDGNFYGTALNGGASGDGTVFKFSPSRTGGTLTTLYSFCSQGGLGGCTDGAIPFAPLIQAADGNFYGTTTFDGANVNSASCAAQKSECGTVFKITPSGTLTTLYSFCSQANCTDGANPNFPLVQATDGNFYGSTASGGVASCTSTYYGTPGCGTVYKLTPGGVLTTLHSFDETDGDYPSALFQATNGALYGATLEGGTGCTFCGTVFSLDVGLDPFVETVPPAGTVGEAVTILGTDLSGATHVRFNHAEAAFNIVSNTEIQATVPAGGTTGFVTVTRHGPRLKSNVQFQVLP